MALQPQKKAKQYAAEFNASEKSIDAFDILIKGLWADMTALLEHRKPSTMDGVKSIVSEIDHKWKAIASRCEELNPEGFMKYLMSKPEMKEFLDG